MCRAMVGDREGRVDFGMAEALAFGTLALHRGVRPPQALQSVQQASADQSPRTAAQRGAPGAISHTMPDCAWCFASSMMPKGAEESCSTAVGHPRLHCSPVIPQ